jgi:hypothetical protein
MSVLAIAFPAEAAVPIARTVIDSVSDSPMAWSLTATGIALLLALPLRTGLGHARDCFNKQH